MFLQVGVPEKEQLSLRFLWREMSTVHSSHLWCEKQPKLRQLRLEQNWFRNAVKFPEAALAVKLNFYMDDYLDSRPTLEGTE